MKISNQRFLIVGLLCFLCACGGRTSLKFKDDHEAGQDDSSSVTPEIINKNLFRCTPGQDPAPSRVKRLTRYELLNTYRDIFGEYVMTNMASKIDLIPNENTLNNFDNLERVISTDYFDGLLEFNYQLAGRVVASSSYSAQIGATCFATAPVSSACIRQFLTRFGKRAYRRPLESEEMTKFELLFSPYSAEPREGLKVLLTALLSSPQFMFRLEDRGTPVNGRNDLYRLSAYEVATKLSYMIWGSLPDTELMTAADQGSLLTESGLQDQVNRMLSHTKARSHVRHFYSQWMDVNNPIPSAYSAEFLEGLQIRKLLGEGRTEILDFIDYVFWEKRGNVRDLLLDRTSFAKAGTLAGYYGVPIWVAGTPHIEMDEKRRAGVLTRMAMLATGDDSTHPFKRGSLILSRFQCTSPARPQAENLPDGALSEPPIDGVLSTRERYEHKTAQPLCMTCHAKLNPFSFAMESYDSIGRFRETERIISAGTLIGEVPVRTIVTYDFIDRSEIIDGPVQLSRALAHDSRTHECATQQWYRFGIGQIEAAQDGCMLSDMYRSLTSEGGSFVEMFKKTALHENFRIKKVGSK